MFTADLQRVDQIATARARNSGEPDASHVIDVLDRILDKGIVIDGRNPNEGIAIESEDSLTILGLHLLAVETEVEVSLLAPPAESGETVQSLPRAA